MAKATQKKRVLTAHLKVRPFRRSECRFLIFDEVPQWLNPLKKLSPMAHLKVRPFRRSECRS